MEGKGGISQTNGPILSPRNNNNYSKEVICDVYSWGQGVNGRLGHGDEKDVLLPQIVHSLLGMDIRAIACGPSHTAAITVHGELFTWGSGKYGRLGHGNEKDRFTPLCVNELKGMKIVQVACGDYHTMALTDSGELFTWGKGSDGRLGHGSNDVIDELLPRPVSSLSSLKIIFIACGYLSSAAVSVQGRVYSWGGNEKGQLGLGDKESRFEPTEIVELAGLGVLQISCGSWHSAAVSLAGEIFTWGNGANGKLGHMDEEDLLSPKKIEGLLFSARQVSCGDFHTAVLSENGEIYTWGEGNYGQLGHGAAITQSYKPMKIGKPIEGRVMIQVACGANHTSALTNTGGLYTWGYGVNGRLGHGDESDQKLPKIVMQMVGKHVKQVACGGSHSACTILHGWVPDDEVQLCMSCKSPFTFYKRKHHCRNCGGIYCRSCSSKRFALVKEGFTKPVRVCDKCYDYVSSLT